MNEQSTEIETERNSVEPVLVSVVIPVYNISGYLSQCLESVIRQSYRNLEIIVIDDGSTDDGGRICDEFARRDSRIRVLHTENQGLSSARNTGLRMAEGSYLLFVDGDDWIEVQAIETLLKTAMQFQADIVAARCCSEYIGESVHPEKAENRIQLAKGNDVLSLYKNGILRDVVWNKLYHMECLSDVHFPEGHNFEDVFITWRVMTDLAKRDGTIAVLSDELFHFRARRSSISHTHSLSNIVDHWTAKLEKFDNMPECRDRFLPACISLIGLMWSTYSAFTNDEKRSAKKAVCEMRSFSRDHFQEIIKGPYSNRTKAICCITQISTPPIMYLCFYGRKLIRVFKKNKRKLFD